MRSDRGKEDMALTARLRCQLPADLALRAWRIDLLWHYFERKALTLAWLLLRSLELLGETSLYE